MRSTLLRAAVIAVALGILALAAYTALNEDARADEALAIVVLALLAVVLLVAAVLPSAELRAHLGRVKSVSLGSLGIELADYRSLARSEAETEEGESKGPAGGTLLELRMRLERKLTYLAKHVLALQPRPEDNAPTFITIGGLCHDGLFTPDDAKIAYDILTMRDYELHALEESERRIFLEGAKKFVDTVRLQAFAAQVKLALEDAGWTVIPDPGPRERRDLLVQAPRADDGTQHHVIPVFALSRDSSLLASPAKRLSDRGRNKVGGQRLIVVPPLGKAAGQVLNDAVQVVTLDGLLAELERPPTE